MKMRTLFISLICLWAYTATQSFAETYHAGDIHVMNPWARTSPPGVKNGVAYLTLMNKGRKEDRLIGVSSPVAKKVELHTHEKTGSIMRMRRVKMVPIKKGIMKTFRPGGFHIMLKGLRKPLKNGTRFPLTLIFANAGRIKIDVRVY